QDVPAATQRMKLFEAVQTAIQQNENLAASSHHIGNSAALGNVETAARALKGAGAEGAAAYAGYTGEHGDGMRNALLTGKVNSLPFAPPHHVFAPGSREAVRATEDALRRMSAGRLEKMIVGKRSLQEPGAVPYVYQGQQTRDLLGPGGLVVPT